MGILTWVLLGLLAGAIAKFLMPGKDPGGFIMTTALGILGALVGGFIGTKLGLGEVSGFNVPSMALAVGGAVLLLAIHRLVRRG